MTLEETLNQLNCIRLKTPNPCFKDTWEQNKLFDIRLRDRGFKEGDFVLYEEYDKDKKLYLNRKILAFIDYMYPSDYGLQIKFCAFSFKVIAFIDIESINDEMINFLQDIVPLTKMSLEERTMAYAKKRFKEVFILKQNSN